MALDLRGYRVFLSSPGGLESERRAFYQTILEVNEIEAEARSRTFIPVGWEREAGWGRPQERLNDRLRECDYVVLILADRWGSPTGGDGGGFSSGTEEEYNVACDCLVGDEAMRDIVVLFKGVPERQLVDPGAQLKKVLDFKAALERERSLLFATFDSEADLTRILRRHLLRWLRDDDGDDPLSEPKKSTPPPSPSDEATGEHQTGGTDSALDEAQDLADRGKQARAEGRFAEAVSADTDDLQARYQYSRFLRHSGRLTHAIEVSKELISLAKKRGETKWAVEGLGNLGICQRRDGLLEDSRESLAEAVSLAQGSEEFRQTVAYLENNLGLTLRRAGELGQAEGHYNRALRIYEELDDADGLAYANLNLSYVIREQGDLAQARRHAEHVVELDGSDIDCLARAHCNLGLIAEEENKLEEAQECFEKALTLNADLGNVASQAVTYAHLARVKLEGGDEPGALEVGGRALGLNEWSGNNEGIAMSLHVIGQIEMHQSKFPVAESRLKDARDIYIALDYRIGLAGTWADLARLLARTQRETEAGEALDKAREYADGIDHVSLQRRLERAEAEVTEALERA